jgi:hypothetical protein
MGHARKQLKVPIKRDKTGQRGRNRDTTIKGFKTGALNHSATLPSY